MTTLTAPRQVLVSVRGYRYTIETAGTPPFETILLHPLDVGPEVVGYRLNGRDVTLIAGRYEVTGEDLIRTACLILRDALPSGTAHG